MKKFKFISLFAVIALALFLSACSFNEKNNNEFNTYNPILDNNIANLEEKINEQEKMKKFTSIDELRSFLNENANNQTNKYLGNAKSMGRENIMMDTASPVLQKESSGASEESLDYSETNVQVEGIDEADIVKTDGDNIYTLSGSELYLLSAYPGEDAEIKTVIEFETNPSKLYLSKDKLIVLGYNYSISANTKRIAYDILPRSSYMFAKIFDVSNISEPVLEKEWEFEGNYSDSRLLNDSLYLISNKRSYNLADDHILPAVLEDGNLRSFDCDSGDCLQTSIYYYPRPYTSYNYTNVYKIDLSNLDSDLKSSTFLVDGKQTAYMSHNNLYLTYSSYIDNYEIESEVLRDLIYPYLSEEEKQKIIDIEEAPDHVLSSMEKQSKVRLILESYLNKQSQKEQEKWQENLESALKDKYFKLEDKIESTIVHKINLSEDNLEPDAQGQVPGTVLNQFSIDEHKENLRIATTKNNDWQRRFAEMDSNSENNVYILDESLERLSSIEDLAKGERIYSARFMGDRIYLVTFKQVDPLFVIDASNAKNPKVLGELKIPGFSNYLHPYNENTLIGFGKDTYVDDNDNVRTKGLKLSLFDVTNPVEPKEIDTYTTGDSGSYSEVLHDHKALLFSKERNLLVLPVRLRSDSDNSWEDSFNGALVFNTENKEFNLRGKINHVKESDDWRRYYNDQVRRSLYIENQLYTVSDNMLKINDINTLDLIKDIDLEYKGSDFNVVKPVKE
ncbi:MAG TPA: beta-propeller domain-containing protein [Patescibacteria group bacterium]|nr:beta-propeller domain-containing protein [Patescibacteria group bacterium]